MATRVFVDTSAFYGLLDADEPRHEELVAAWDATREAGRGLWCSNYVVVETLALVQHRLGIEAARALATNVFPLVEVVWIETDVHAAALAALFTANRRGLSFVDCTSFELMRRLGIEHALALDDDFRRQGFQVVPDRRT